MMQEREKTATTVIERLYRRALRRRPIHTHQVRISQIAGDVLTESYKVSPFFQSDAFILPCPNHEDLHSQLI